MWCLNSGFTMLGLLQNLFDCFGPYERFGGSVVAPNELFDRRDQLRHTREDTSSNVLARNLTEPPLDEVEP